MFTKGIYMSMEFSVLASGSSGNVSLLRMQGMGIMVDLGLGPRLLSRRLQEVGSDWQDVNAVLLSHTHSDHWQERSLACLVERRIPLYCHAIHENELAQVSPAFNRLREQGLLRNYTCEESILLEKEIRFRALPLSHDCGATSGFRIDSPLGSLGYVSDLGTWQPSLATSLANVDILAVEFNHDVGMERNSNRSPHLIARVLGDCGHLSNDQASELVSEVLRLSEPGRPQHLVQLHLSRQCNRPTLARNAALRMLNDLGIQLPVHTARQDRVGPILRLGPRPKFSGKIPRPRMPMSHYQPLLPGWED
jgi:phosphoribosyl 1,2-cyclic phosphodiesterase